MGGNKSKPLADTARKVVARRVENPNPINDISLSSSNQYPVRKDILDEMSKWPAVHTSVVPKKKIVRGETASAVRIEKDKLESVIDLDTKSSKYQMMMPEEKLLKIMQDHRELSLTPDPSVVSEQTFQKLIASVKYPEFIYEEGDEETAIAR